MIESLNYCISDIYLQEIPDEISLGISFTGCPMHCIGCHSPFLQKDHRKALTGMPMTNERLLELINKNNGVSCFLAYGGDWNPEALANILYTAKANGLKTALYSGNTLRYNITKDYWYLLDYIKTGAYIEALGGLHSPNTNQQLFMINHTLHTIKDITYKLQRKF